MILDRWSEYFRATRKRSPVPIVKMLIGFDRCKSGRALDIGCGAGVESVALARAGFRVDAVDIHPEAGRFIADASPKLPITVRTKDIAGFKIRPATYAVIVAWNSIPFLKKSLAIRVLRSIKIGLRPGGYCALGLFGPKDDWAKSNREMTFFSLPELRKMLSGLEFIRVVEDFGEGLPVVGKKKFWHRVQVLAKK